MEFSYKLNDKILTMKPIQVENLEHQCYKPFSVQAFSCIERWCCYFILSVKDYQRVEKNIFHKQ